ncbi:hypothetical protein HRI_001931200 [Hibiscus trionum]|uniref:Uncharacterized protein n=1 Tax=Hibiscus trionum TaxID=183268 RepID=A0A9W7HR54_HIBTR|nr:hypothetical protein HRI_001931200 [Hibiscus trionum]
MAQNNLILSGALLLTLLLAYGVTISEGIRVLKAEKLDEPGNHLTEMMSGHKRNILEDASAGVVHNAYRTDDVHPTPHGHSPGAGHSTGPASNDNN